jgi:hypothetical protein
MEGVLHCRAWFFMQDSPMGPRYVRRPFMFARPALNCERIQQSLRMFADRLPHSHSLRHPPPLAEKIQASYGGIGSE